MTTTTAAQPLDLDKILPCPFCGGTETFVERLDYSAAYVQCDSRIDEHSACLARGPIGVQDDDGEEIPGAAAAIRAWNNQAALTAKARAAQPESATGTTGASIPTWQERFDTYEGSSDPQIQCMYAEIADLRAHLAAMTESLQIAAREAWDANEELSKLRAQLAAKGQSDLLMQATNVRAVFSCPQTSQALRDQALMGLSNAIDSARASAQPAVKDHVLREVVNSLRDTALVYHAHGSLRERLRQCLDPLLPASAQPDRGAAQDECTQPMLEAAMKAAVASGVIAKYADEEAYLRNWDSIKACVNAALAAAPSPASQPVAPETAQPDYRVYDEACNLAKAIHAQHYRDDSPNWRVLPDLRGVISQISNMVSGMTRTDHVYRLTAPAAVAPSDAKGKADVCKVCNGTRVVDDGEIDCYPNGEPFMCGPVKCVKDCPECAKGKADAANAAVLLDALQKAARLLRAAGFCMNGTATSQIMAAINAAAEAASHPDDAAVDRFATAMKVKMAESRAKGRGGWEDPSQCPAERLQAMLADHLAKGDPVDVGNFAMMLWNRGERTATSAADAKDADSLSAAIEALRPFARLCPDGVPALATTESLVKHIHLRDVLRAQQVVKVIDAAIAATERAAMAAAPSSEKGGA